jgi:SAM-dependent methyltransferase
MGLPRLQNIFACREKFEEGKMGIFRVNLKPSLQRPEWFRHWFESAYYHSLYSNRDDKEAAGFINELTWRLQPAPDSLIVDLGCGTGRHSRHLAAKGYRVTGLDLAAGSIARARAYETSSLRFSQHDMRLPFGRDCADYILNLFTSFGYFTPYEHHNVLRNISNALRPGGRVVIDYLNVDYAEARLLPFEEREIDGIIYRITRWSTEEHFFKSIAITDSRVPELLEYTEQVAKFTLQDFSDMLVPENLRIQEVWGDYRLDSYDEASSPRMIIVAGTA